MPLPPQRVDVLGVGISAIDPGMALAEITRWIDEGEHHYVCVTGVHGVMESQRDPELMAIHNRSGLTTPDGMPMVWAGHRAGAHWMQRVYGPDLMLAVLALATRRGWSSYFYGGGPGVVETLVERLKVRFPGILVAGAHTPPFRMMTDEEDADIVSEINSSGAHLVWVGLSTPKQERWMAAHLGRVEVNAMFGVGAAFDFHAGLVPQAPPWMQRHGLEWLYRVIKEPRRLWKRYARNNPGYVWRSLRTPPFLREP